MLIAGRGKPAMHWTVGLFAVLTLVAFPALAEAPDNGPAATAVATHASTPETLSLARAIVRVDGTQALAGKLLATVEDFQSKYFVSRLAVRDEPSVVKVRAAVHAALAPIPQILTDAKTGAFATMFSADELRDVLAFLTSPGGQVEQHNLPLMKLELAKVLTESPEELTAARASTTSALAAAPTNKRALILRIMLDQDVEGSARKGYAALFAVFEAAAAKSNLPASKQEPDNQREAAIDDYAKTVVAIEEGFYLTHFTDEQLSGLVAYAESKGGSAMLHRRGAVYARAVPVFSRALLDAFQSLPANICKSITCSAEQKADLASYTALIEAILPAMMRAFQ
jgi:hypothetical protein